MVKHLFRQIPKPNFPVPLPIGAISTLKTPTFALSSVVSKDELGVYASSDTLFKGAVFGRDSLEVAEDLMYIRPRLVKRIIMTLAFLQGQVSDRYSEEEPGKIVHEYRRNIVDGKKITGEQLRIFKDLTSKWGGNGKELRYYGSVDATPHFLKVVREYCQEYGDEILLQSVVLTNGEKKTLLGVVEAALEWLIGHINRSKTGLIEYHRQNPHGIENQVWKDSKEFYVHENGKLANHSRPIASIEVQALAYDALMAGRYFFPERQDEFMPYANNIQAKTLQRLWLPNRNYFALGFDFDKKGSRRVINTITANPAALLDSHMFDLLSDEMRQGYVSAIAREIMGTEFLTDAGIRSRALSEAKLVSFWDYHGSFTSWPKETYDIAKGLRRQGLHKLAIELENRLVNAIKVVGAYPEFIYIDARGRVLGMPPYTRHHGELVFVDSPNRPEKIQAWTVSAFLAITSFKIKTPWNRQPAQEPWQSELEKEVLRSIPHVKRYRSRKELTARYPIYPYELKKG